LNPVDTVAKKLQYRSLSPGPQESSNLYGDSNSSECLEISEKTAPCSSEHERQHVCKRRGVHLKSKCPQSMIQFPNKDLTALISASAGDGAMFGPKPIWKGSKGALQWLALVSEFLCFVARCFGNHSTSRCLLRELPAVMYCLSSAVAVIWKFDQQAMKQTFKSNNTANIVSRFNSSLVNQAMRAKPKQSDFQNSSLRTGNPRNCTIW